MPEKENKKIKNSMFVDLFYEDESAEQNDISLYNALHDEPLPEGTKIQKIRIENVLYLNFQNDISFGAGGKVLIFEDDPMLDLTVKVININPDEHHEILEKCPVLKEYGLFIDTVRYYQRSKDPEPYRHAIAECIENNILADYLRKKGTEVRNMLIAEYDYDLDMEVQREEAFEEGRNAALDVGIHAMLSTCAEFGISREEASRRLQTQFSISAEEAEIYLQKYWAE